MRLIVLIFLSLSLVSVGVFLFEDGIAEPDMNDPVLQNLAKQLSTEGYKIVSVESTWLGRFKVEAHSRIYEREIILAPGAGTLLRDDLSPLEKNNVDGD